ncbi:MAG: hypothetical protein ABW154_00595 [Dyella sp.]
MRRLPLPFALFAFTMTGAALSGCQNDLRQGSPAPVTGFVTDLERFRRFIDGCPTPAQFHAAYPDVQLVLPGTVASREVRMNNSRYFAELNAQSRIVGGQFM